MNAEEFNRIVSADVKGELEHHDRARVAALRDDANVERWYEALCELIRSVDFQFAANKADVFQRRQKIQRLAANSVQAQKEFEEYYSEVLLWKKSTSRFKREAQTRLDEARRLRRALRESQLTHTAYELFRSVEEHYLTYHDDHDGDEADLEKADAQLWQAYHAARPVFES